MADFEVIPVSRLVARRSARLRFTSRAAGRPVKHRTMDILIAATALTYSLQLVTSDTDFDDIPGLQLLDPRTLPYDALGSIPTVAGITTT